MATQKHGANGPLSGKIGNLVYCQWKGINYVRSRPRVNKRKKATAAQQKARSRFAFMQQALSPIVPFLRMGYKSYAVNQTEHNAAMSYNLREAIKEEDGVFVLAYEKFSFAKGEPNPVSEARIEEVDGSFIIHWVYNTGIYHKYQQQGYKVMVLAYPEGEADTDKTFMQNYEGNLIDKREYIFLNEMQRLADQHIYIAFQSTDGSNSCTDSLYIGVIPKQEPVAAGVQAGKSQKKAAKPAQTVAAHVLLREGGSKISKPVKPKVQAVGQRVRGPRDKDDTVKSATDSIKPTNGVYLLGNRKQ